jgi:hypothetical protein
MALPPPEIQLRDVQNETPLEHLVFDKMGRGREYFDVLLLKGTFKLAHRASAGFADERQPIVLGDELYDPDNSERSAIRQAGEVVLTKPTTDVMVTGHARAPGGEPATDWQTMVEVIGHELEVSCGAHVFGPGVFRHVLGEGWMLDGPAPVTEVPIRYDLAFGGAYKPRSYEDEPEPGWVVWEDNPSGVGFLDFEDMDEDLTYPAPQWLPDESWLGKRNAPLAGYGPIPRPWSPRLKYAGTYDEEWLKKAKKAIDRGMSPDYARDFDTRFFQCAHPGLIMPRYLVGNELFRLTGLMPGEEPFEFQLPCISVAATLSDARGTEEVQPLPLDTVTIDTDSGTVSICWRLSVSQRRRIGHATITMQGTP